MIVKLLGIIDIVLAIFFFIGSFFQVAALTPFIIFFALILLIKGFIFLFGFDFASLIDIIIAFIIIVSTQFTFPFFIVVIIALFLLQKGIVSMMS